MSKPISNLTWETAENVYEKLKCFFCVMDDKEAVVPREFRDRLLWMPRVKVGYSRPSYRQFLVHFSIPFSDYGG